MQVLGTKDRADDLTVDSRRLGDFISGAGGKTTLTPEALQILGPGAVPIGTLYTDSGQVVLGAYKGGAVGNSIAMDGESTFLNGSLTGYYGGTILRTDGTYGGAANAAGLTLSINGFRSCVPNVVANPTVLSSYFSRDHVALCSFMQAAPSITVPGSGTTYTANTITNPSLVAGGVLRKDVVIDTAHSPKWSGVVTAIDDATHTVTVSGWYRVDGSGTTGAPSNGVGAVVNPATKTWVSNTVQDIGISASDNDAIGHELDQRITRAGLGEIYGWDAVAYGQYQPNNLYAFTARHGGQVARYHAGLYALDTTRAAVIGKQTSSADFGAGLLRSEVGPDVLYNQTAAGKRSADRVTVASTAVSITVDPINTSIVICTNGTGTTPAITLPNPTGYNDGRIIEVVALGAGSCTVNKPDGTSLQNLPTGYSGRVVSFGNAWQPLSKSPVN